MSAAGGDGVKRAWLVLAALVLAGGLVRFYAMESTFPVRLLGDERYYVNTALNIAQGRGHVFKKSSRLWRPHSAQLCAIPPSERRRRLRERGLRNRPRVPEELRGDAVDPRCVDVDDNHDASFPTKGTITSSAVMPPTASCSSTLRFSGAIRPR